MPTTKINAVFAANVLVKAVVYDSSEQFAGILILRKEGIQLCYTLYLIFSQ